MKNIKKKCLIIGTVLLTAVAALCGFCYLIEYLRVEQTFTEISIELGDTISREVGDYLDGREEVLEKAVLDTEEVDEKHPGQYRIYCDILNRQFTYIVYVEDTTAPFVEAKSSIPCLAVGTEYGIDDFIGSVTDLSEEVDTYFLRDSGEKTTEVSFAEPGKYDIRIRAQDGSGNFTDTKLTVEAEMPPVLFGIWDRYIVRGTEHDFLEGVIALDARDGFLTEKIEASAPDFDGNTEGEYKVVYTVQNSNGLSTSRAATIFVCEENNAEAYAQLDEQTLSGEELQLLCEAGYFRYAPLEEANYDKTLELVRPTLLNVRIENFAGSGFIVDINPEYIYCISVEHVTRNMKNETSIVFFDDTCVNTTFDYLRLSGSNEIVLFRIPTSIVPYDTLVKLKQISVDLDIYAEMKTGEPLIEYCANWGFGFDNVVKKVTLKKTTESVSFRGYDYINTCIETSRGAKHGMSGTAVVDYRGNLVGVVSIINYSTSSDLSMRIDKLDSFRERISEFPER